MSHMTCFIILSDEHVLHLSPVSCQKIPDLKRASIDCLIDGRRQGGTVQFVFVD